MMRKLHLCFSIALLMAVFCGKSSANAPPSADDTNAASFTFIDIRNAANRGFRDDTSGDSNGGWADFGPDACLRKIPFGRQLFEDVPIPFFIIDPQTNAGSSVIVLSGPQREEIFPKQSSKITINDRFSEMYFLHTTMYPKISQEPLPLVQYRIGYQDGSEHIFVCRKGKEIDDWWDPPKNMPHAQRTYNENDLWLFNTPWKNPHPEKTIEWIRMESTGNAIPILVAITGANNPPVYESFTSRLNEAIRLSKEGLLKIALIQPIPEINQAVNLQNGEKLCRDAKAMGADIAVFPEMYSVGYYTPADFNDPNAVEQWGKMAVAGDGPYVTHFQKLANELQMAIVITYLENRQGRLRNSATLFDRHGKKVLTYSKVHTCAFFRMEASLAPGDDFYVGRLDTRLGPVQTGIMICYDREFPESARILMLQGAELILTPNACGLDQLRLIQFQVRAWENCLATAMANYAEGQGNGHSCAFNADGKQIIMADANPGVYLAEVDIRKAKQIRKDTYWGNAWRRPQRYKELISTDVDQPFLRNDAFGKPFDRSNPQE